MVDKLRMGFLHIRKCAGTAAGEFILRHYYDGVDGALYPQEMPLTSDPERVASSRFYWGHYDYDSLSVHAPSDTKIVTFLRDPKRRVISHYLYCRSRPWEDVDRVWSVAIATAKVCDLETFLSIPSLHVWPLNDNHMTRQIGGAAAFKGTGEPVTSMDDALDRAIANLDAMLHVGFMERYAESMTELCEKLEVPPPAAFQRVNVGGTDGFTPSNAELAAIDEMTKYDQKLYEYAFAKFAPPPA